jgi:hypothetical protein
VSVISLDTIQLYGDLQRRGEARRDQVVEVEVLLEGADERSTDQFRLTSVRSPPRLSPSSSELRPPT